MDQVLESAPRRKILLAEDERDIRALIQLALTRPEREIVAVADGSQAVTAAQAATYDLIILDRWMPALDGDRVGEIIRTDGPNVDTPILYLSGSTDALPNLAAIYRLNKPFTLPTLLATINRLLE